MLGRLLKNSLIVIAFLLGFCLPVGVAAQPVDPTTVCTNTLEASRNKLLQIAADMQRKGVTDETLAQLLVWRDSFRDEVEAAGIADRIEGIAVGTGTSVLAAVAVGGPPGWGVAALGALFGSMYVEAKTLIQTVNNWGNVDANTAFYQYLLDYLEYGRVGDIDDGNLQTFVSMHGALLQQLTGSRPPASTANLDLYLQANAESLMLFFGYFEETMGTEAFPRWKFPAASGRFGPSRLDVGYYRQLLAGSIAEQIRVLEQDIARLEAAECQTAAPVAIAVPVCSGAPANGITSVCRCDTSSLGIVWGSDLYSNDSDVCAAAVHAGLVRPRNRPDGSFGYVGTVEITGQLGCPYYQSSTAYGVVTAAYEYWSGSFFFPATQRGLCDNTSTPSSGVWYCPSVIGGSPDLTCHCTPEAVRQGSVWGTTFYTDDSSVCGAAAHSGRIGANGGTVRVIELGPLDSYQGSDSNGISSSGYGAWGRSIGFP